MKYSTETAKQNPMMDTSKMGRVAGTRNRRT